MAGTKISNATTTAPIVGTDMIPFARSADETARHVTVASFLDRAIVINESGADADFRVEAVGQENTLFVQGSDGRIGFGTSTLNYSGFPSSLYRTLTMIGAEQSTIELGSSHADVDNQDVGEIRGILTTAGTGYEDITSILFQVDGATAGKRGGAIVFYTQADNAIILTERMRIGQSGDFTFNSPGNDADFRVEAVGEANALFVQGSDGHVGIGTGTPDANLHVNGSFILGTDGAGAEILTLTENTSGEITVTKAFHQVDTYDLQATGNLTTINGGIVGMVLLLSSANNGRDVTIKHGQGDIECLDGADIVLSTTSYLVMLIYGTQNKWLAIPIYAG